MNVQKYMNAIVLLSAATPVADDDASALSDVGVEEAKIIGDGICAYLELPSNFMPRGNGTPVDVAVHHSGLARAAQTASVIKDALVAAKCGVDCSEATDLLAPNADAAAVLAMLNASSAALTVVVAHPPLLSKCAAQLGATVSTGTFAPAGGVVLEASSSGAGWTLAHSIDPPSEKKSWWMQGVSVHVRSDADKPEVD